MSQWFAQAPSNIALIKYMGKEDDKLNIPANPSLSYTLDNLKSNVKLELYPGQQDLWEPLEIPGFKAFELSLPAQNRFLKHLTTLKEYFHYSGNFIVRSSNNFPHSSGLASSASSFAALTKCAVLALSELTDQPLPDIHTQAHLSRLGSGSSCRSFFRPWALWEQEKVDAIELPYSQLIHHVVIISDKEKEVSSKMAHHQIHTSPHYVQRPARARERLKALLHALQTQNWLNAYEICWDEFIDMHQLFESASPPFSYINEKTETLLSLLKGFWQTHQDGPIVTMDAGPNVHLLFRPDQHELANFFIHEYLVNQFDFL